MTIPAWVRGTVLLAVTFTTGIVTGVSYERRRILEHEANGTHHMLRHLSDELGLDTAQQRAIAAILARRQGKVDSTWHVLQPHVRAAMDSTLHEIAAVLRPDQAAKFRNIVETRHPGALR